MTRTVQFLFLCFAVLVKIGVAQAGDDEEARKAFFVGASMVDAGEYEDAIPWLEKSIEEDASFCRAHFYLAQCYAERGTPTDDREAVAEAGEYESCAGDGEADDVARLWRMLPDRSSSGDGSSRPPDDPPPPPPEDDGYGRADDRSDAEDEAGYGRSDSRSDAEGDDGGYSRADDEDDKAGYGRSDTRHDDDDRDGGARSDDGGSSRSDRGGSSDSARDERSSRQSDDDDYRSRRYGRRDNDRSSSSSKGSRAASGRSDDRGKSDRSDDRGKNGGSGDEWDEEEDEFAYLLDLEEEEGGRSSRDDDRGDSGYRPSTTSVNVRVDRVPTWKKRKIAGGIIMGVGAGVAAGGFVGSVVMYRTYYWETDTALYSWARNNTILGTAIGIGGAAAGLTGLVVMLVTKKDSYGAMVLPGPVTTFTISFR